MKDLAGKGFGALEIDIAAFSTRELEFNSELLIEQVKIYRSLASKYRPEL